MTSQKHQPTTTQAELVSVIIPLYNARPYIEKTINSILSQTVRDLHLYLIDDHSTDGSADVAKDFAAKFPDRVTYFRPETAGKRPAVGKNVGIAMSRGEFVAFMDHDDWWEPNHLELLLAAMRQDPSVGLAGANADIYDSEQQKSLGVFFPRDLGPTGRKVMGESVLFEPPFATSSCMMLRRSVLDKLGAMDDALYMSDDHEIAMRIYLDHQYKIIALPTMTIYRRWHAASLSNTKNSIAIALSDVDHIYQKFTSRSEIKPDERLTLERWYQTVRRRWANYLVEIGDIAQARQIYATLSAQGKFQLPVTTIRGLLAVWPWLARRIVTAKRRYSFAHPHLHP